LFQSSPGEVGFYGAAVAAAQAGFPFFTSGPGGPHHHGGPPTSMAELSGSGGSSATSNLVNI